MGSGSTQQKGRHNGSYVVTSRICLLTTGMKSIKISATIKPFTDFSKK